MTATSYLQAVLDAHARGGSIIPILPGTKKPACFWKWSREQWG
jgi:hypothetical protein